MDTFLQLGLSIVQAPTQLQNELDQLKTKLPSARLLIGRSEWSMFKNKDLDDLIWQLKDAAYDAEDLLRYFEDLALRQKIEATGQSWAGQLCSSTLSTGRNILFDSKRIRDAQHKLEKIMAEVKEMLGFMGLDRHEPVQFMPTTTEIITAPEVFGRDAERDQVMEMLGVDAEIDRTNQINQVITQMGMPLTMGSTSTRSKRKSPAATGHGASARRSAKRLKGSCSSSTGLAESTNFTDSNVSVLPIFGIGGIGKTTLAQLIYNDKRVKSHFTEMIWVCVSDLFDDERMTKEILKTISEPEFELPCDIRDLRAELRKQLKNQKFLLVLDDMWEITQQWEHFYEPLRHGLEGSMILLTTRHETIAHCVATSNCKPVKLEGLPTDTFWEFFKKCAFDKECPESYLHLHDIGRSICSKLHGTPLAAKTLGRLLNSNLTEEHWMTINNSELWEQEQKEGDILPALRLSYLHLPYELRRCFAFCSMFPKDYSFERYEIVDIWVAEGFIAPQGTKRLEDVGICYFDNLRGRYLFQTDPKFPKQNRYVMHDLIHDTAQQASKHECFLMKDSNKVVHKFRHMSIEVDAVSLSTMADIQHFNKLRSLRFVTKLNSEITWFSQLSNIVFLSIKGCMLEKLPESICECSSLRYLDISHSRVKELPARFWCLYNLQVFDASRSRLLTVDGHVTNLINLRQLALPQKASLTLSRVPGLSKLSCLRNLSYFTVVRKNGGIGELKGMNQLRGMLCIRHILRLKSKEEAAEARLVDKKYLKNLDLHWRMEPLRNRPNSCENDVADGLCPNERIECLKIHGFGGDRLPSWFTPNELKNIRSLELSGCSFLKSLSIPHFSGGIQGGSTGQHASSSTDCSNGIASISFAHLTAISIVRCDGLENLDQFLSPSGQHTSSSTNYSNSIASLAFTHLTSISIARCNGLKNLDQFLSPVNLPSVRSIVLEVCRSLKSIPVGNFVGFIHLQDLKLRNCDNLVCPQPSEELVLPPSIRRLCIWDCGELDRSFPSSWLDRLTSLTVLCLFGCHNVVSINCPNKLKYLDLSYCTKLSSIGGSEVDLSSIAHTLIFRCPKLTEVQEASRYNALPREELEEIKKFLVSF